MSNIGLLGNPSTWAALESSYIPAEYTLSTPKQGIRLVRRNIRRQVDTTLPATPNTTDVRFKIPSSSVVTLDFRKGAIHIIASVSASGGGGGWSARLSHFAWNMFTRFRLEQHNQYIDDRQYFNFQETFHFWTTVLRDQFRTTAVGLYGGGSPALRNSRNTNWEYQLPIPTDSLCKSIMPWFQLINIKGVYQSSNLPDVWMIWNFADPNEFIECYGGVAPNPIPTYSITSFEVEYDEITLESGNTPMFLKSWHTSPSSYPRIRWPVLQTMVIPMTQSITQAVTIDVKVKVLQAIVVVFQDSTAFTNPTITNKYETWIGPNDARLPLQQYQWELNNNFWPDQPIVLNDPGLTDPYKKSLELFGNYYARFVHSEVTAIGPYQFGLDKFFIAFDGNQFPFTPGIMSPVSTENSTKSIILRMQFTSAPAANLQMMIHTLYYRQWDFAAPSGKIVDW